MLQFIEIQVRTFWSLFCIFASLAPNNRTANSLPHRQYRWIRRQIHFCSFAPSESLMAYIKRHLATMNLFGVANITSVPIGNGLSSDPVEYDAT